MNVSSAKAKGRRFQQQIRELLIEKLNIYPEDIESRSMGAGGEDLIMARDARNKFPFSIEAKNCERLNVWSAYEQAQSNAGNHEPILFMKKNRKKPLVVIDADSFVDIIKELNYLRQKHENQSEGN